MSSTLASLANYRTSTYTEAYKRAVPAQPRLASSREKRLGVAHSMIIQSQIQALVQQSSENSESLLYCGAWRYTLISKNTGICMSVLNSTHSIVQSIPHER